MSPAAIIVALELVLLLGGLALLWRRGLSPAARHPPVLLPAWDVALSDFFLLLWLVLCGGFAGQYCQGLFFKYHPVDPPHQLSGALEAEERERASQILGQRGKVAADPASGVLVALLLEVG